MKLNKIVRRMKDFLNSDVVEVKAVRRTRQPVNEQILAKIVIVERETKHIVPIGGSYHVSQPESWLIKVNFDKPLVKNETKKRVETLVKTELAKFDDGTYAILIRGMKNERQ